MLHVHSFSVHSFLKLFSPLLLQLPKLPVTRSLRNAAGTLTFRQIASCCVTAELGGFSLLGIVASRWIGVCVYTGTKTTTIIMAIVALGFQPEAKPSEL